MAIYKNQQYGKSHVWKEKHAMDHKPVLLKQESNKQELTKLGKYPYNKKQKSYYKF